MYQSLQALNPDTLKGKHYRPYSNFLFAEKDMAVEIVYKELPDALATMPLGFMRPTPNGPLKLMALLSVLPDKNTYVNPEGKWVGDYVPAVLRGYPMAAVPHPQEPDRSVMCIDEPALCDAGEGAQPLFDEEGNPGSALAKVLEFWQMIAEERKTTQAACRVLDDAGLIVPWDITVQGDAGAAPLNGFYRIDEARLNALEPAMLASLRPSGALTIAYAHLFSRKRVQFLQKATSQHAAYMAKRKELDLQLDGLFGNDDDIGFGF